LPMRTFAWKTEYGNCTVSGNNSLPDLNMQFSTMYRKQASIQSKFRNSEQTDYLPIDAAPWMVAIYVQGKSGEFCTG
ncbi:hypothetical protein T07_11551, partial [Trichinella nelsoni]